MLHFCTYFDQNYLSRGLALYHSLAQHATTPFTLWTLCFDNKTYDILSDLNLPHLRLIALSDFENGDEALLQAKAERSLVEYYWTCTPSLPLYILNNAPEVELITYLDADMYFYNDPYLIFEALGNHSIFVVEHRYTPEHAHMAENCGIFNVGSLAFRRDENGLACLKWWRERCLEWCYARFEEGRFGDQKYLDTWPEQFQNLLVMGHPGVGLAPWNLAWHTVQVKDQQLTVDDQPLIFFHFHGYKLVSPNLAITAPHVYEISTQQIAHLYLPYAQDLQKIEVQLDQYLTQPTTSSGVLTIIKALLQLRLLLLKPRFISLFIWRLGSWRLTNLRMLKNGHNAFIAGDLQTARHHLLKAIFRDPSLMIKSNTLSMLFKSFADS